MHRRIVALATTITVIAWCVPAFASPFRIVVRISSEQSRALWNRIEGQTSDLDVDIVGAETTPLEPSLALQVRFAAELADRSKAGAVVWFDDTPPLDEDHQLVILQRGAQRLLVRGLDEERRARPQRSRSAELENAALIVRAAAQALMNGKDIGVETAVLPPPAPMPMRAPVARPEAAEKKPAPTSASWHAVGSLGWQSSLNGTSDNGQHGPSARLGVFRGNYALGLAGLFGIESAVSEPMAQLMLARHAVALWAEAEVLAREPFFFDLGLQGGLTFFHRATVATAADAVATEAQVQWTPFIGPEIRASVRPRFSQGWGGVSVVAGCDVIPSAPVLGYEVRGKFSASNRLWPVEPRLGLEFELRDH